MRVARSTGHLIGLYYAEQADLDACISERDTDGLPWLTVCEDHSVIVNHRTLELARSLMSVPEEWCQECADEYEAKKESER